MDFATIKEKIVNGSKKAKDWIIRGKNKVLSFWAKTLSSSNATIKDKKVLEEAVLKSKNTSFVDKKTNEKKTFKKRVIIIFWNEKSDFFKEALLNYPILVAKAFSQNVVLKLAVSNIKDVDFTKYGITKFPSLVVFENNKVLKVVSSKESILKLVKSFNLDINKEIDNL